MAARKTGEPQSSAPKLPTLTPGGGIPGKGTPSGGGTPGPGGFAPPGGGIPGGKGPGAGDTKATGKEGNFKVAGQYTRDKIEKAIFETDSDPGHYWEVQAANAQQQADLNQAQLEKDMAKANAMDKALAQLNKETEFFASVAFEKLTSYANALLTWKEAASFPSNKSQYEVPQAVEDKQRNLVRYYLNPNSPTFVKVWSTAGQGSFPGANEAVTTPYPQTKDGLGFQDFPLLLDNRDTTENGQVIPSVVRAMHEQDPQFLFWISEALAKLVQLAQFPKTITNAVWKDGTPKFDNVYEKYVGIYADYKKGYPNGFGENCRFLASPSAKHGGPSWLSGGTKGFNYNGWWLDKEIGDYVAALVRFKIALQNRNAFTGYGIYEEAVKASLANVAKYQKKAEEARQAVQGNPVAVLKQQLQAQGAGENADPALVAAALEYVDICVDLRSVYDNADTMAQDLKATIDQYKTTYFDFAGIQEALDKAQYIADNKLTKATTDTEKKLAFQDLWKFLQVARDLGVEKCVEIAKDTYQKYVDATSAWKPDPKAQKYLAYVFPQNLVDVGIDSWGPTALKIPIAVIKKALQTPATPPDYATAISQAVKVLDQYKKLLKMLPEGYAPPGWSGNTPIPGGNTDDTKSFTPGISLSMTSVQAKPGESTQLAVAQIDSAGTVSTPTKVSWLSSNPDIATISDTGIVTANAVGDTTVTAKVDNFEAIATVKVTQAKETKAGPNWLLIGGAAAAVFLAVSLFGGKSKE